MDKPCTIQQHPMHDTIIKKTIFDLGTVIENIQSGLISTIIWFSHTHRLPKEQPLYLHFVSCINDTCKYIKNRIVQILLLNDSNKVDKEIHAYSYVSFIQISK